MEGILLILTLAGVLLWVLVLFLTMTNSQLSSTTKFMSIFLLVMIAPLGVVAYPFLPRMPKQRRRRRGY